MKHDGFVIDARYKKLMLVSTIIESSRKSRRLRWIIKSCFFLLIFLSRDVHKHFKILVKDSRSNLNVGKSLCGPLKVV
jgi:hypothetical protein